MFIIGLTGGIASGKSTVSQVLHELGAAIIDVDQVAKDLQQPHTKVWQNIVDKFGREILQEDERFDRKALGQVVFNNPEALQMLNGIVHPGVIERSYEMISELERDGQNVAVLDVPLLIEAKMTSMADEIWLVAVPEEVQITRLMARNGFTREEALARLQSQMPLKDKRSYADIIIDNSGSMEETRQMVVILWKELLHRIAV